MISTLFISKDKKLVRQHAINLIQKQNIDAFDRTFLESEAAIGIEDIKNIQKNIFLAPFKSKQKAIVIYNFETATVEAQNALLKILEEPPVHTIIILTAASENALLPTIISRCKIISFDKNKELLLSSEETIQYTGILDSLNTMSVSEKFVLAQNLAAKEKEETQAWFLGILAAARNIMLKKVEEKQNVDREITEIMHMQSAYQTANTTNINLRFLLEHLFLSIPKV